MNVFCVLLVMTMYVYERVLCSLQASILDLHSGALSKGDKFIDIYE